MGQSDLQWSCCHKCGPVGFAELHPGRGILSLGFDGNVKLTNAFVVATNVTLDATGRAVSLDGGGIVRHFTVTNGAVLRLINLTLANGRAAGADGQTKPAGQPGVGWIDLQFRSKTGNHRLQVPWKSSVRRKWRAFLYTSGRYRV